MLVGPRYMRVTRLLSSDSWYSASMVFVARQICALDDDLTAPPARAAIAAVAAVAAGAIGRGGGGRGGRGHGVGVPAVPAVAYAPMPSSAFDEDIRLGFPEWLNQNALPVELASAPRNRWNARLEMQARARYATGAVRSSTGGSHSGSFSHLSTVAHAPRADRARRDAQRSARFDWSPGDRAPAGSGLNKRGVLSSAQRRSGQVRACLQEGGGPSSVAPDQRVQLVLNEHAAESMRRRAS